VESARGCRLAAERGQVARRDRAVVECRRDERTVDSRTCECPQVPNVADAAPRGERDVGKRLANLLAESQRGDAPADSHTGDVENDQPPATSLDRRAGDREGLGHRPGGCLDRPAMMQIQAEQNSPRAVSLDKVRQLFRALEGFEPRDDRIDAEVENRVGVGTAADARVDPERKAARGQLPQNLPIRLPGQNRVKVGHIEMAEVELAPDRCRDGQRIASLDEAADQRPILITTAGDAANDLRPKQIEDGDNLHRAGKS
jgi:hypothetical protein